MKVSLSCLASGLGLVAIVSFPLLLSGCSIEDTASEEIKLQPDTIIETNLNSSDPAVRFIAECNKCIRGDLSNLQQLIETYHSTFTSSTTFAPNQFLYQRVEPTQAFEKCAEKAKAMGDNSAFSQLIVRPARISRIARFFYIKKEYAQGAFWLQRVININGEQNGLYTAGRIFIQDIRTIDIGVKLLEQSARLGNREARQMLLGLMQPGSSYYQSITRNVLLEDERSGDKSGDSGTDGTNPDLLTAKGQAEAREMATDRAESASTNNVGFSTNTQRDSNAITSESTFDKTSREMVTRDGSSKEALTRTSGDSDFTSREEAVSAYAQQSMNSNGPARTNSSSTDETSSFNQAINAATQDRSGANFKNAKAQAEAYDDYTSATNLPAIKRNEHSARIREVQAKAEAAAAAAEKTK